MWGFRHRFSLFSDMLMAGVDRISYKLVWASLSVLLAPVTCAVVANFSFLQKFLPPCSAGDTLEISSQPMFRRELSLSLYQVYVYVRVLLFTCAVCWWQVRLSFRTDIGGMSENQDNCFIWRHEPSGSFVIGVLDVSRRWRVAGAHRVEFYCWYSLHR